MNVVREAGVQVTEVVADIDDAILGKPRRGDGARQDVEFRAAAVGAVGVIHHPRPKAGMIEPHPRRLAQIGGGNAGGKPLREQSLEQFPRALYRERNDPLSLQSLAEVSEIGRDDGCTFVIARRPREMVFQYLGNDFFVIADAVAVPVL